MNNIAEIKQEILDGKKLNQEEALTIINTFQPQEIYQLADELKHHYFGNSVEFCSIANAKSGLCSEDCKWCSQSVHHEANVSTYDMIGKEKTVNLAKENEQQDVNRFSLVTSGRTVTDEELDQLIGLYQSVQDETELNLCASMGLLSKDQLQKLWDAGVRHYHCNIETAPSYFEKLCTTHTIEEKLETIRNAQELGMTICSGGIIGMGESMEQRMEMAVFIQEMKIESIPINFLNPIEGTPLQNTPLISDDEILLTVAMFRIINPKCRIRIAGGRDRLNNDMQKKLLRSGVCSLLVGDYLTTLGNKIADDKAVVDAIGGKLD